MGWHAHVEHAEMALEVLRRHPSRTQRRFQVCPPVEPLSTGGDFDPVEQQIEARRLRSASDTGTRVRVEGPGCHRESRYEYRWHTMFALGLPTELAFSLWIEIVPDVRSPQPAKALFEVPHRGVFERWQRRATV